MADDTDITPYLNQLAQYGVGTATTEGANQAQLAAYQAILQNLNNRFADYNNLKTPNYGSISAQQLGPSALSNIQPNAQARTDEQSAIAQLQDIADRGGLSLADMAAINQIQQKLGRGNAARQQSLANQYAARGQLGSGAQLAMDLANQQSAAEQANQAGESQAAQAQQRAMQAVLQKAQASRTMGNDDYARQAKAAEAADAIAKYNAGARTDASKYNNTVLGQSYEDQLKKLQGETGLTNSLNTALLGQGNQKAAGINAQGNNTGNFINGLMKGGGSKGSGGTTSGGFTPAAGDTATQPGGQDFTSNLQPDVSDLDTTTRSPASDVGDYSGTGFETDDLIDSGSFA